MNDPIAISEHDAELAGIKNGDNIAGIDVCIVKPYIPTHRFRPFADEQIPNIKTAIASGKSNLITTMVLDEIRVHNEQLSAIREWSRPLNHFQQADELLHDANPVDTIETLVTQGKIYNAWKPRQVERKPNRKFRRAQWK
jgi:hypothetical protein